MNAFTLENPVFATYVIAAAIMVLKIMGQGWMTVYRMLRALAHDLEDHQGGGDHVGGEDGVLQGQARHWDAS